MISPSILSVNPISFITKKMAIIDNTPGNILRIIAKLISGLRIGKRMQLIAYATINTKKVEMMHVQQPMTMELRNHAGKFATVSGLKNNCA